MNFTTQIKCTVAATALFLALGFAAFTRAEAVSQPADAVVHPRIEIGAPVAVDAETVTAKVPRVHVGAPIAVDAEPSTEDLARASR